MLTWAERLILCNQFEILKKLYPERVKEYEKNQEIIANGYEQYYSELNTVIYRDAITSDVSEEVEQILDVFRAIKFSSQKLGYEPKSCHAEFNGFDANNESDQYVFAQFVRRVLGKWKELQDRPDNSHGSTSLDDYRRMLRTWQKLGKKYDLSEAEIEKIAESAAE